MPLAADARHTHGRHVVPVRALTADPLAGNSAVAEASARFAAVNRLTAPSAPAPVTGGAIEFAWDQNKTKFQAIAVGCSASWAQPLWTFTCTGKTSVNLGTITVGGGINVDFNVNGAANVTYNFSGSITNSGSKMQFGPGTYNIARA